MDTVEMQVVALSGIIEGKYYPPSLRALARALDAKVYRDVDGAIYALPCHEMEGEKQWRIETIKLHRDAMLVEARDFPRDDRPAYIARQRYRLRIHGDMLEPEVEMACAMAFEGLEALGPERLSDADRERLRRTMQARFGDLKARETEMLRRALRDVPPVFVWPSAAAADLASASGRPEPLERQQST